ncbi:MAG: hypothetical protein J6Y89_09620 [Lachnospiraceae bacterium]|nr:hypothetical protein [Lachnospiraceae bacterium]
MHEALRVFNKKSLILLLILCVINMGIFILCADPGKNITKTGEELDSYIQRYPAFLDKTITSSRVRSNMKLYGEGFAADYLKKSMDSYTALKDIEVRTGDNRGLVLYFQYHLTELFVLVFILWIVMDFFTERRKGLDKLVRSTPNGRSVLFVHRILIIAAASVFATFLMYGSTLLGLTVTLGMDDITRSIQSIPEFMKCTYRISISEYLLLSWLIKAAGFMFAGILMYVILGIFGKFVSYLLTGALVVFEIAAFMILDPVSSLNAFKYINIYTLIKTEDFFNNCIYLNIFQRAVPGLKAVMLVFGSLTLIMAAVGFFVHAKMYVRNFGAGEKLLGCFRKLAEKIGLCRPLMFWECRKVLVIQGAMLVFAGLIAVHIFMSYRYEYIYPVDAMKKLNYMTYHGEITEELYQDLENEMTGIIEAGERLAASLEEAMKKEKRNEMQVRSLNELIASNNMRRAELEDVAAQVRTGYEYSKRTGRNLWLIEPFSYELLINRDLRTRERASFLALIAIIGALGGIYAFDRQNNMSRMLASTFKGPLVQKIYKPVIAGVIGVAMPVCFHLVQYIHLNSTYHFPDLDVPVQSIPFLMEFPLMVSIRGYIILSFAIRAMIGMIAAAIVSMISLKSHDRFTATGTAVLVFSIGMLAAEIVPAFGFLNFSEMMGMTI